MELDGVVKNFNKKKLRDLFNKTKKAQQKAFRHKIDLHDYLEECFGTSDVGGCVDFREHPEIYTFEEFLKGEGICNDYFEKVLYRKR